jgi:hypothetical protein
LIKLETTKKDGNEVMVHTILKELSLSIDAKKTNKYFTIQKLLYEKVK